MIMQSVPMYTIKWSITNSIPYQLLYLLILIITFICYIKIKKKNSKIIQNY